MPKTPSRWSTTLRCSAGVAAAAATTASRARDCRHCWHARSGTRASTTRGLTATVTAHAASSWPTPVTSASSGPTRRSAPTACSSCRPPRWSGRVRRPWRAPVSRAGRPSRRAATPAPARSWSTKWLMAGGSTTCSTPSSSWPARGGTAWSAWSGCWRTSKSWACTAQSARKSSSSSQRIRSASVRTRCGVSTSSWRRPRV
mmetsp:Transcript_34599/g.102710  ORF Transcript_34599/g.102710 Transcript_34599/m.102710 type:complete len:201 (-) Transcript_34599:823-1425(-)